MNDTIDNHLLHMADSLNHSVLMGWDSVCRQPRFWEDTLVPYVSSPRLFDGIPFPGETGDTSLVLTIVAYAIFFLGMIAFLRLEGKGILPLFFLYVFSRKRTGNAIRENLIQSDIYGWCVLFLSYSVLSLGIAFLWEGDFSWYISLLAFLCLLGYQLSYFTIISLLGWTFNASRCASDACLMIRSVNVITGLLLSPFILSLFFIHERFIPLFVGIMGIILLFCFLVKWIRLFGILFDCKISVFYMILYLCILEIIPLLVLYKLLV